MSDKMRESFEGWAKSESMYLGLDVKGNYINTTTHLTWIGWQASRAAMVVELPEKAALMSASSVYAALDDAGVGHK